MAEDITIGIPNISCLGYLHIDLLLFSTDPDFARRVIDAGAAGVVVDWERRGKHRRQAGVDTQVNADTPHDLTRIRAAVGAPVLCRVNGWGPGTAAEIESAIGRGADEVLLPMVRRPEEVDAALAMVGGRAELGILVETSDALRRVDELVRRPLSRIYVGLNDLMIDRGSACLFTPLVDDTVARVARAVTAAGIPFGVAGLTLPDRGRPVPCRLLIGEVASSGASFTFLRRSFHADVAGRDPTVEVPRIVGAVAVARRRDAEEVAVDRAALEAAVSGLAEDRAG